MYLLLWLPDILHEFNIFHLTFFHFRSPHSSQKIPIYSLSTRSTSLPLIETETELDSPKYGDYDYIPKVHSKFQLLFLKVCAEIRPFSFRKEYSPDPLVHLTTFLLSFGHLPSPQYWTHGTTFSLLQELSYVIDESKSSPRCHLIY